MGRGGCVVRAELIYDKACPNVESARAQLRRAFVSAGIAPHWQEWEASAAETPAYARGYGSPTILVDGRDVAGGEPGPEGEGHCRIYALEADGPSGVPAVNDIVRALKAGRRSPAAVTTDRRRGLAASSAALLLTAGTLVCCALPILLVALGLGSAVAAMTSAAPWLVTLSQYKLWFFTGAALALVVAGALLYRPGRSCPADPELARACARIDRVSRGVWWLSVAVWLLSAFFAFAWLPLQRAGF